MLRYEARDLFARLLFQRGNGLAIFLNVELAPGNHLGSHVEGFSPLIGHGDGFERVQRFEALALALELVVELLRHGLNIRLRSTSCLYATEVRSSRPCPPPRRKRTPVDVVPDDGTLGGHVARPMTSVEKSAGPAEE
jgi:hypothetical protein